MRLKDCLDAAVVEERSFLGNGLDLIKGGELAVNVLICLEPDVLVRDIHLEAVDVHDVVLALVLPVIAEAVAAFCL